MIPCKNWNPTDGLGAFRYPTRKFSHADEFITFEKPTKPFFRILPEVLRVVLRDAVGRRKGSVCNYQFSDRISRS
jgi:hypothetical protein